MKETNVAIYGARGFEKSSTSSTDCETSKSILAT
jgi:hypothetical protein